MTRKLVGLVHNQLKENDTELPDDQEDLSVKITFAEFWAICKAQYAVVLPQLALTLLAIFIAYGLFWFFFIRL